MSSFSLVSGLDDDVDLSCGTEDILREDILVSSGFRESLAGKLLRHPRPVNHDIDFCSCRDGEIESTSLRGDKVVVVSGIAVSSEV